MKTDNFEDLMRGYGSVPSEVPENLSAETFERIKEVKTSDIHMLPYLIVSVIFINMLVSIMTGSVLYLMRPLVAVDWLVIGGIYSGFNGVFYGLTYVNREKVYGLIIEIGGL